MAIWWGFELQNSSQYLNFVGLFLHPLIIFISNTLYLCLNSKLPRTDLPQVSNLAGGVGSVGCYWLLFHPTVIWWLHEKHRIIDSRIHILIIKFYWRLRARGESSGPIYPKSSGQYTCLYDSAVCDQGEILSGGTICVIGDKFCVLCVNQVRTNHWIRIYF